MLLKTTALLTLFLSSAAWADAASELQQRLSKVNVLSADYAQTVSSSDGKMFNKAV
ncbi:hypothetical protein AAUPMC_02784, partial [Pasteurella multocida subsp. multocida str. Anand1_cattle]